jgi:hypothetical protein
MIYSDEYIWGRDAKSLVGTHGECPLPNHSKKETALGTRAESDDVTVRLQDGSHIECTGSVTAKTMGNFRSDTMIERI